LRAKPIRRAVATLAAGLSATRAAETLSAVLAQWQPEQHPQLRDTPLVARAAWNLVSIWLLGRLAGALSGSSGFDDAEIWFCGPELSTEANLAALVETGSLKEAQTLLASVDLDLEFQGLLPYILEEHGPGSRASVLKDPRTAAARAAKRHSGVFYTPSDVADYMVAHVRLLHGPEFSAAMTLDPACGTGVFLLAMLRAARQAAGPNFSSLDYVTTFLHGLDINCQALDAAAYLLLGSCLEETLGRGILPRTAWEAIRRNLLQVDALTMAAPLPHGKLVPNDFFSSPPSSIQDIFPSVPGGFPILIGNPPYTALGDRADYAGLASRFSSLSGLKAGPRVNTFPLFIEMMWRFTKPGHCTSALVTPLSIAFGSSAQLQGCRRAMVFGGGRWQFAFFDRQPHALFGEEVKTRNAILFRSETPETPLRGSAALIGTGPMRKWTSRTRKSLFRQIDFTPLDSADITHGIPKLEGELQAGAFLVLRRRVDRFTSLAAQIGTCPFSEVLTASSQPRVFVGGTAYNFLNVYRPLGLPLGEPIPQFTENPVHCIAFKTEESAHAAFAILSSRLVYWLWHILGDGFHVTTSFVESVPFGRSSFSTGQLEHLTELGVLLWRSLQGHCFVSLNRGKQTIGFRPLACTAERDAIDQVLVAASGLSGEFSAELRRFVQKNAVVDPADQRRNQVSRHFAKGRDQ